MPLSALPPELQDIENHFPDDAAFGTTTLFGKLYYWYQKHTKTMLCFSYRCTERWARWRKYPKVLFAVSDGGNTPWRFEGKGPDAYNWENVLINRPKANEGVILNDKGEWTDGYLSRIQYYKRFHFAVQWPLMVSLHVYFHAKDVPAYGEDRLNLDGKLFYFYWNHYDNDNIYWMFTSIYLGGNWK